MTVIEHPNLPLSYVYEVKVGNRLLLGDEVAVVSAVEKMDGTFIQGGPDGNTAVAMRVSFESIPPIISHPRTRVHILG